MKRALLVCLSDTHAGSKLSLMNPDVVCYDEDPETGQLVPYTPNLTASQKYLWGLYVQGIEYVKDLAGGDDVYVIHNGDITQGNKYPQQLVSTRMADQITIACANVRPLVKIPNIKAVRIVAGTGSHAFEEASSEILVTSWLKASYPDLNTDVLYHGHAMFSGLDVDYAHHGPGAGIRAWTKGNVAYLTLKSHMMSEVMRGKTPPRLYLYSHFHEYIRVDHELKAGNTFYNSTLIVTPSFSMLNDHARQVTRSESEITNGMVVVEIVDGKILEIHKLMKSIDIRTREIL
jgi:hypothetical protein